MKFKLACAFLFSMAVAWPQMDLTGKWQVSATPEGRKELRFDADLKQEGAELSGMVNSPLGSGPVKNAVISNPNVTFQFFIGKNAFDVEAALAEDGALKGTFSGPRNMKGMFLARRNEPVPAGKPAEGIEVGEIAGSSFRIDIPANYNGSLVIFCHGYGGARKFDDRPASPQIKAFTDAGYAFGQAGYSSDGWAVKEAIDDTEALRKHFVTKYGRPTHAYVTGQSMGGVITIATIEKYSQYYDAAMPICGPLGASIVELQKRVFDILVVFDYYFPGAIGSPVKLGDNVIMSPAWIGELQKVVDADPEKRAAMQRYAQLSTEREVAQVVGFFAYIQKELMQRAGGNPFDNTNTLYFGTSDDIELNRGVKRYGADAQASEYLRKYYTPTGQPTRPILSLHTTYDQLVPAWAANPYGELTRRNGTDSMYVQRFVSRGGHCNVRPDETLRAFQDLVSWRETGKRPDAGEQK